MNRSLPMLAKSFNEKMGKGFRMFMPNMPIIMTSARSARGRMPARAIFRVLPRMTKHEIKEYLTKIYGLPVTKVNTQNYLGKRKIFRGPRKTFYMKYADFKRAIVTFDPKKLTDVGTGMRIPEIDDANRRTEDSSTT